MNKVNFINKTKKQLARLSAIQAPLPSGRGWGWVLGVLLLSSCSDILDTSSELVEFQEDNTLDHPTDSVYSVMGIVNRMQLIADRSVLLGEIRSDLVTPTEAASADLKRLAAFDFAEPNKYCQVSDYYAVINNCNYYLANVDTTLQRRGRTLFRYEYAAVKAFRAWTYLELVKNYGQVPLVTEPVMTEREAEEALTKRVATIKEVCDYFIADLTPYALVELPQYGDINSYTSTETAPTGRKSPYYAFDFDRPDSDRGDYIFVPKDAVVHSYACIDDDIKDRQYSSDHCPVLAIVTIK